MPFPLIGRWEPTGPPTNHDECMDVYGVPQEMRSKAKVLSIEAKEEGEYVTMTSSNALSTSDIGPFVLGQPFERTTERGKIKYLVKVEEANKVIMDCWFEDDSSKNSTSVAEVTGDTMTLTLHLGNVTSVSQYKRV